MTATAVVLTSLHGKRVGLTHDKKLVVDGYTVPVQDDAGVSPVLQGTPGTLNATGTLTAALIATKIVTSTTAAAVTATVDTGTAMDTALSGLVAIGEAIRWSAINTGGAGNAFTVTAAAAGHTLVGVGAVADLTSAEFLSKRTAANTWVTFRLS